MSTNVPPLDKKSSLSKLEPITPFYNKHSRGYSTSRSSQEPVTSITRRSFSAKSTSSFQKYGPPVNDFQPISPRRRRNTIMKLSEALKFNPITKLQKIEYNKIKINERIPETVLDLAHSTCQNTNINEMDIERDIEQFNLETKNTKTDHPPLDLNHMKTDIGKLISLYYNYHLFLFEDEKRVGNIKIPFDDNDVTDCRICVHTMELTHMELLRCFIKILENVKDSNEFIIETFCKLILKKGYRNAFAIDSFVKMGTFIEVCKIKESEVFGLQTRDPFYIIDGNSMVLSEASNEILMKLVFSRTQETSNFMEDYIHFTPYITNFEETFENFVKILNNLNQQSKEVSYSKDWMIFCISRFEKMIIYWLSVMEDAIYKQAPKLFNRIGNVIGSSNILTSQFKKEISLLLQRYSNVKDVTNQFHPYDKNHVQMIFGENRCSIINTTESGDVSNVFEIIDKIKLFLKTVETEEVTKQLILFDQETLSKVCTYDLYLKKY
ncbi:Ras-GEF domain-containing protein [Entamoeba marina]